MSKEGMGDLSDEKGKRDHELGGVSKELLQGCYY